MSNTEHLAWLLEGVESWNLRRSESPFTPDLRNADLSRVLAGAINEGAVPDQLAAQNVNLSGANLSYATLKNADLSEASFRHSNLQGTIFSSVDLTGADFGHSDLRNVRFVNVTAAGTFFGDSSLDGARVEGGRYDGAWFNGASLRSTEFAEADLRAAHLQLADFRGARFWRCNLKKSRFNASRMTGAQFAHSRPWRDALFSEGELRDPCRERGPHKIEKIEELLAKCRGFREVYGRQFALYFRGEARCDWELRPSVMRRPKAGEVNLRTREAEMLTELMTRMPEAFLGADSALARWVLAQHHGLRTRLLDITRNPLVSLFFACEGEGSEDGRLHVFVVPVGLIKTFESDVSKLIANFARLPRREQRIVLDRVPSKSGSYESWAPFDEAMKRLRTTLERDAPHVGGEIDVMDLYETYVIEPERRYARVRAQSGAFLVSAFHERLEREEVLRWNRSRAVYWHHSLTVLGVRKAQLLDELRLLNVTRETLFPGVDEAARAITREYLAGS